MGKTFPCFRLCFLTYTLAVLFETGGVQPTMANVGCPVVRLSGEYDYQSDKMTTYSVTSRIIGNRPVYDGDTTDNFLFYLESTLLKAWLVGPTPGMNSEINIGVRDNATLPELITQGTFEVKSGSQFVSAPDLRVSCSVPGYIGCYHYEFASDEKRQWTSSSITIEACKMSCRHERFRYTALYGTQCWCANHIQVGFARQSRPHCDYPCGGDSLQFCGTAFYGYTEVYQTIADCGPVPVTPGVTSVRPSHGANITVEQTVEVDCWNGSAVTVQCLQNGTFNSSSPFCPEPEVSTTASPDTDADINRRSGDKSTNIILIVGGVVAGLVFIVIAAVAAFFLVRKRNAGLDQETPASSQRGTNLGNSTYYEPVMSDVVLTDTGAQYLPNATGPNTSAAHPRATDGEPQYSTIPEYSTIDEMDRKGVNSPQTKNNNLDQLYSKPVKKTKDNREEGMVDNVLYETSDDVIDGEGATGCNGQGARGYVDNDMYG